MLVRILSKFAFAFLVVALLFTNVLVSSGARQEPRQLVVHEWGTFTTVSTAGGEAQMWNPLGGPSELPSFVHRPGRNQCAKCNLALARMETPVLYFYADRETEISVKVGFPRGRITEWYPRAEVGNSIYGMEGFIEWGNVVVRPGAKEDFPSDRSHSHYYPARETDSAPIRVKNGNGVENEKYLFYRGMGNFSLPLTARLAGENVVVRNTGTDEIAKAILFERQGGRVRWATQGNLKGEATIARPTPDQPLESLGPLRCELEAALIAEGLYPKEAAAMVKTWRDSWFEEGLRVFYIVPRTTTEKVLPISVNPKPAELVRVMVGRTEIITPEMERTLLEAAKQFNQPSSESRAAAIKTVRIYGRFAEPVLCGAIGRARTGEERARIWELIQAASAG